MIMVKEFSKHVIKKLLIVFSLFFIPLLNLTNVVLSVNEHSNEIFANSTYDYSECETYHKAGNSSSLYSALKSLQTKNSKSYKELWTTYKTAYLKDDNTIFDYYSNISSFIPGTDQAGSYKDEGDVYNREHSIPKSWWGGNETIQGADPVIVVPTDGKINNMRSNYPFGMVKNVTNQSQNGFSKLGTADSSYGYSGTVFEPDDSVKGDFARIMFYAIVTYDVSSWTTSEGKYCFSGSTSTNYGLTNYSIKLFTYWNNLDPVSEWEKTVNNRLANIQNNRNPFVDHPEYINTLFKGNSNLTPYDDDSEDTTSSINLSQSIASIKVGETLSLTASLNNISGTLNWYSTDTNVAIVSPTSGTTVTISGVSIGSCEIYAYIGNLSASCAISVTSDEETSTKILNSISAKYIGEKIYVNDALDESSLIVTASYTDATTYPDETVSGFIITNFDSSKEGTNIVSISYTYELITKSCTIALTIYSKDDTSSNGVASWIATSQGYTNAQSVSGTYSFTDNKNIKVTFSKGSNSSNTPTYYTSGNAVRLYAQNQINITSTLKNIKKIVLGFGTSDGSNEITVNTGTYSSGTWTYSDSSFPNSVTFTVNGSSGNRRISSIKVYYYTLTDFGEDFLNEVRCDNGVNQPSITSWNNVKSNYYDILFSDEQTILKNTTSNENGTISEQAMARYDYIIHKYNIDNEVYTNYINRALISNRALSRSINTCDEMLIIVTISISMMLLISVIGLGLYLKEINKKK